MEGGGCPRLTQSRQVLGHTLLISLFPCLHCLGGSGMCVPGTGSDTGPHSPHQSLFSDLVALQARPVVDICKGAAGSSKARYAEFLHLSLLD